MESGTIIYNDRQVGLSKMSVSIEQKVENLKRVIVDCVKEEFKDSLPNATITVYLKTAQIYPTR